MMRISEVSSGHPNEVNAIKKVWAMDTLKPANRPVVITCAVTGGATMKTRHPFLPITPREIAASSVDAAKAGAAIVHIHVRDPETGHGTSRLGAPAHPRQETQIL